MAPVRFFLALLVLAGILAVLRTEDRQPWTASKVVGAPEPPPPYRAAVAFRNLKFDHPVFLARCPGLERLYVGEQRGRIYSFENKPDAKAEPFFDLRKEIATINQHPGAKEIHELYGLAFHPKFETNRECFICYTLLGKKNEKNLSDGTRVSRFKVKDNRIDPASEEILLTWLQGGHNGGDLHFGPDGYLYISTGDAADPNPPDPFKTGQNIADLLSSILRVDVDHRDPGKNYAIPKDNPFVGATQFGKSVRGEVWAYGFRNPWRMSFDCVTGDLWAGDVGWEQWEMVFKVERGGNYGWSIVEGRQQVNSTWPAGPTPIRAPAIELDHAIAASVTGGYVYRGKKHPDLLGKYIVADWSTRKMWAATMDGDRCQKLDEIVQPNVRVVAFGEDNSGELYFLDYDTGVVHELQKNDVASQNSAKFPLTLSQTGIFNSVKDHTPASGVYKYEIVAEQWQDGATADRWIALPQNGGVIDHDERRPIPGDVDWHHYKYHFPKNAVLVKTLSLPTKRRVETQLLHFDGVDWHGYSYCWRDDQSDADLVDADGAEQRFVVNDERVLGGKREINWNFASRTQCMQCHNFWAEYTLGFSTPQLNREVTVNGTAKNQLLHLTELNLMTRADKQGKPKPPHNAASVARLPKLVNPHEMTPDIELRARSYLHANCAHCHRFGGGGAVEFELNHDRDFKKSKVFDTPTRGNFEIPNARVIAPGDPNRSVLFYRMAKFGSGRMPHLGSEFVDEEGVVLIHNWITRMSSEVATSEQGDFAKQLQTIRGGLDLARVAACDCTPQDERERILAVAAKLPPGNVRDLFEGYLTKPGGERKLGANPKPKAILSLTGDVAKGRELFVNAKYQCVNCHKYDGKGAEIGPNLMALTGARSRVEILESVLDPSRRVEAAYQAYLVKTTDGRSLTGLVVNRTDAELIVKSADGKDTAVKASDVESVTPSRTSLMANSLIADLTPQQAADLLAFLMHLKDAPR